MTWMLRLYPRAWRERYGDEISELIRSEPRRFRLFLDLMAGAIDARINPQPLPAVPASAAGGPGENRGDSTMSSRILACARTEFSRSDKNRSAAWLIVSSLAFVVLALVIQLWFDETLLSQMVLYAAYPMGLIIASRHTFLKPYSSAVRRVILAGAVILMFAFFMLVTIVAQAL